MLLWWAPSFDQTPEEKFGRVIVQYHLSHSNRKLWDGNFWTNYKNFSTRTRLAATKAHDVVAIACLVASAGSKHYMQL